MQTAISDFTSRFYDILTKEDIIQILINHAIDYRKSWNKGKLWRALTNSQALNLYFYPIESRERFSKM